MRVILCGSDGQLGYSIKLLCPDNIKLFSFNKYQLDITNEIEVREKILTIKPHTIINAAAFTKVDNAEINQSISQNINAKGPSILSVYLNKIDSRLIHISTDYVFDGKKNKPYVEDDRPNPLSIYGRTKLDGEKEIEKFIKDYFIFRVSWLFGPVKSNFVVNLIRKSKEGHDLKIVNDQYGKPTCVFDFAKFIWHVVSKLTNEKPQSGIYHFSNNGDIVSWFEYAKIIFDIALKYGIPKPNIIPITSNELNLNAIRPQYSVLDSTKSIKEFDFVSDDWKISLEKTIQLICK